jgi:predicted RNase H-like HicB family nuclease
VIHGAFSLILVPSCGLVRPGFFGSGGYYSAGAPGSPRGRRLFGETSFAVVRFGKEDSPTIAGNQIVQGMKARFTYWKESDGRYLGFLNDYPDHWTQGDDLADLKEQLRDLLEIFGAEEIPGIRKVEELEYA